MRLPLMRTMGLRRPRKSELLPPSKVSGLTVAREALRASPATMTIRDGLMCENSAIDEETSFSSARMAWLKLGRLATESGILAGRARLSPQRGRGKLSLTGGGGPQRAARGGRGPQAPAAAHRVRAGHLPLVQQGPAHPLALAGSALRPRAQAPARTEEPPE